MKAQVLEHIHQLVSIDAKKTAGIIYYHCFSLAGQALGKREGWEEESQFRYCEQTLKFI